MLSGFLHIMLRHAVLIALLASLTLFALLAPFGPLPLLAAALMRALPEKHLHSLFWRMGGFINWNHSHSLPQVPRAFTFDLYILCICNIIIFRSGDYTGCGRCSNSLSCSSNYTVTSRVMCIGTLS